MFIVSQQHIWDATCLVPDKNILKIYIFRNFSLIVLFLINPTFYNVTMPFSDRIKIILLHYWIVIHLFEKWRMIFVGVRDQNFDENKIKLWLRWISLKYREILSYFLNFIRKMRVFSKNISIFPV